MHGWGEAWCNFPSCGAEHRARLLETAILPKVIGKPWSSPAALSAEISGQLEVLRLQADEPGPMSQALAALDIALWDLAARRAGLPLHRFLGGCGDGSMPVYASGINHPDIAGTIRRTRAEGYRCFKIKIGFSEQSDAANLEEAFAALLPGEELAVDVNQAWTRRQALAGVEKLRRWPLLWIEEPLRCDSPVEDWAALAAASPHPLAAGENIRSHTDFSAAIIRRDLGVIQPDICKWGGLSNCLPVARPQGGPALLPPLSRRRHRPAGLRPSAGGCGRGRPAGSGLQPQPPARTAGPSLPGRPGRPHHPLRCGRAWCGT